jgi:periplasmic protein TonB
MASDNKAHARGPGVTVAEPASLGTRRTKVIIVGAGDDLLMQIGPALSDEYHSYSVDTAAEIAGLSASAWIGVYDASNEAAALSAFARIESQYSEHPWVVICADEDRARWSDALARGAICALIARGELSVPTFADALERATQRQTAVPRAASSATHTSAIIPTLWIAGAAVIAVAAGATWWMRNARPHTPPAAAATGQTLAAAAGSPARSVPAAGPGGQPAAPQGVENLLSMARVAFRDPATQLPKAGAAAPGTSALELYGAVLARQPRNREALDGVRRLQDVARLRIQNALAAGDADSAARLVAILPHTDIAPQELRALQDSVAAAQLKQLEARARSAMIAGKLAAARRLEAELNAAAEQVRAAIFSGSLLEPANDNARTRFLLMRELNAASPQTLAVQHELLLALLRRAQAAIGRQDLEVAQQTLAAAQDFGSKADLAPLRGNLDAALSATRGAAAARGSGPALDAKAAAELILSPKPTHNLQVDFPPLALAQNIQGYAIVEFMLNPNGSASAASVVESSPPRTFDGEALAAVRRASFSTKDLADPKKAQRARLKINFTLSDSAAPAAGTSRSAAALGGAAPSSAPADPSRILSPKPTQPLQVEYPKMALGLNRTGHVIVEFMLNPDGTPGSPTVIESVPAKLFDHEALMAVERARFVTTDLADPTKPQRARVKISFKDQ